MKPATPCPDPVPDITICVGEPARGLDPGSVETGTAKAEGAKRTTIAEAVIIEKAIRVRKRGTKRHTNRKPGQWPCLIGIWPTVRSLHIRKRRRPLHLFGQISDAVPQRRSQRSGSPIRCTNPLCRDHRSRICLSVYCPNGGQVVAGSSGPAVHPSVRFLFDGFVRVQGRRPGSGRNFGRSALHRTSTRETDHPLFSLVGWVNPWPSGFGESTVDSSSRARRVVTCCRKIASVYRDGPDHDQVERNDEDGPHRVVGQPGEVGQNADRRDDDRNGSSPAPAEEQTHAGAQRDDADQDVAPPPSGGVQLEEPLVRDHVEVIVDYPNDSLDQPENAGEHEDEARRRRDSQGPSVWLHCRSCGLSGHLCHLPFAQELGQLYCCRLAPCMQDRAL